MKFLFFPVAMIVTTMIMQILHGAAMSRETLAMSNMRLVIWIATTWICYVVIKTKGTH